MSSVMKYKDYIGSVEFSEEDQLFYGKVLGIHSLISYEGESAKELIQDFHEAVDDYLELLKRNVKYTKESLLGIPERSSHVERTEDTIWSR